MRFPRNKYPKTAAHIEAAIVKGESAILILGMVAMLAIGFGAGAYAECGDDIIGVLSLDGQEKNSFTKDDEEYLNYFANALSAMMHFDMFVSTHRTEGEADGQNSVS